MVYVLDVAIKSMLTQHDVGCNARGMWIEKKQEYNIKIKPTKLVRGKAIAENRIVE